MNVVTPISYYGGKQRMLQHILPILPSDFNLYCECRYIVGIFQYLTKSLLILPGYIAQQIWAKGFETGWLEESLIV